MCLPPGAMSFLETPKVEVADTVGAGDSFTGSFCAAYLSGIPVSEAHRLAVEPAHTYAHKTAQCPLSPNILSTELSKERGVKELSHMLCRIRVIFLANSPAC